MAMYASYFKIKEIMIDPYEANNPADENTEEPDADSAGLTEA